MLKSKNTPIRVVIIDDSITVRELLIAILQNTGDIQVIGTGSNGEDAVRLAKRLHPDLVTMDVRMPKMDGLEATRRIMRECPTPIVIVSASMMRADLDLTFQALQAGALTVIGKPGLDDPDACKCLIQTIRTMAGVPVIHHWGRVQKQSPAQSTTAPKTDRARAQKKQGLLNLADIDIIGIAASTGGPSAIGTLINKLPAEFPLPILIVQHISSGFAMGLAEWLSTQTRLRVDVAAHGYVLQPGVLVLAPDDYHMQVNEQGIVELTKAAPYKNLRPSANYLFDSLARVFGPRALGIILTGMGDDGADGIEALHSAGGLTIAQDEESSVVFGMPHEAILRNATDYVFSLEQIEDVLNQLAMRDTQPEKNSKGIIV